MQIDGTSPHRKEFSRIAGRRREQREHFEKKQRDQRQERKADRVEDDMTDMAGAVVMATEARIAEFEARLDMYDEATVKALMENEEELDAVQERIEQMLDRAYELPDGRRVFKTEDGLRVFDEHGVELDASEVDPDEIADFYPSWESYKAEIDNHQNLLQEREDILEFQQTLDEAREQTDSPLLSENDLDDLSMNVEEEAPEAVKQQLPGYEPSQTPSPSQDFANAARPPVAEVTPAPAIPQFD